MNATSLLRAASVRLLARARLASGVVLVVCMASACDDHEPVAPRNAPQVVLPSTQTIGRPPPPPPFPAALRADWFEDVTERLSIGFTIMPDGPSSHHSPAVIGSGCALVDLNGDDRLDLYLLQNTRNPGTAPNSRGNRLYVQQPDGTFADASAGSGLDFAAECMGVATGDVNNDGLVDVLVTQNPGVRLLLNRGDARFTDVTAAAGLVLERGGWATSAAMTDFDRDGWLDLVVCRYFIVTPDLACMYDFCGPLNADPDTTLLFRNVGAVAREDGADVRFENVSQQCGLSDVPGYGLGVVHSDFNADGWPDLLIASDATHNHLWINQQGRRFVEEAQMRGIASDRTGEPIGNMGIAFGDVDNNGLADVYITHLPDQANTLWQQVAVGLFQDVTPQAMAGVPAQVGTGFGTVFADLNNDGWLDLPSVNGRIIARWVQHDDRTVHTLGTDWAPYADRNCLFVNSGDGRFRDASPANPAFCEAYAISRGLAVGDIDGDGALDLVVTAINSPARVFRNVAPNKGHWLAVRLTDQAVGGRDVYDAVVRAYVGDRCLMRAPAPSQSYLVANDPRVHFGLGAATVVDRLEIVWPDGMTQTVTDVPADQVLRVEKSTATATAR